QQLDKIKWTVRSLEKEEKDTSVILSTDKLKSLNYKFVSVVAIATRTAISDGIPLETAFSLSDSLIESLEVLTTSRQIIDFIVYAAEHVMLIYQESSDSAVSPNIKQVFSDIDSDLCEKITLSDIAQSSNMSPSYLSTKFKAETNKGLNQYI